MHPEKIDKLRSSTVEFLEDLVASHAAQSFPEADEVGTRKADVSFGA